VWITLFDNLALNWAVENQVLQDGGEEECSSARSGDPQGSN